MAASMWFQAAPPPRNRPDRASENPPAFPEISPRLRRKSRFRRQSATPRGTSDRFEPVQVKLNRSRRLDRSGKQQFGRGPTAEKRQQFRSNAAVEFQFPPPVSPDRACRSASIPGSGHGELQLQLLRRHRLPAKRERKNGPPLRSVPEHPFRRKSRRQCFRNSRTGEDRQQRFHAGDFSSADPDGDGEPGGIEIKLDSFTPRGKRSVAPADQLFHPEVCPGLSPRSPAASSPFTEAITSSAARTGERRRYQYAAAATAAKNSARNQHEAERDSIDVATGGSCQKRSSRLCRTPPSGRGATAPPPGNKTRRSGHGRTGRRRNPPRRAEAQHGLPRS